MNRLWCLERVLTEHWLCSFAHEEQYRCLKAKVFLLQQPLLQSINVVSLQ